MKKKFKEVLYIKCTNSFIGVYMYTWAKYDTEVSDKEPIETSNGFDLSLGETCKIINDYVSGSITTRKYEIACFLRDNNYCYTEEY